MKKEILKYISIILAILLVVFLSQKTYFWITGNSVVSAASDKAEDYVAKASNWVTLKMYPKVTGEVQKRGDIIKNEVKTEKEKVSENILQKVENYFSGVGNSIIHPGTPQNCAAPATSTK